MGRLFGPAIVLVAALVVSAAQAVRPGKNGAIYFESFNEATQSTDIFAISPSGSGLRAVTKSNDTDEADPSVSPNGRLVAFVSNNPESFWTIAEAGAKKAAEEKGVELLFRKPTSGDASVQKEVIDTVVG